MFKEDKTMFLITLIIALLFILTLVFSTDYQNNNTKNNIRMSRRYYYFKNCNVYIYKDDLRSDQLPYKYYENDSLYSSNHYNNNRLDYKKQYKVIDVKKYKKYNSNKNKNRWW